MVTPLGARHPPRTKSSQKLSYNSLGEGALLKMIVNHHRGDISKLQEIAESRGTAVLTLLTSYNINK